MKAVIVNDVEATLGERTLWTRLIEWTGGRFVGGDYGFLADYADGQVGDADIIIRNASWFGPMKASVDTPTIGIVQDAMDGPGRITQELVARTCRRVVFNSAWTMGQYPEVGNGVVIPLPVDFDLFATGNPMGLQRALGIPSGCVLWVGASRAPAAHLKGYDTFIQIARTNPDLRFIAVFKDALPDYMPFNVMGYEKVEQGHLARIAGACRVGLCTSRVETQHLAGIEMGACGLPVVAPRVGIYHGRTNLPGVLIVEPSVANYSAAIRSMLAAGNDRAWVRSYWESEFNEQTIQGEWARLIGEVIGG